MGLTAKPADGFKSEFSSISWAGKAKDHEQSFILYCITVSSRKDIIAFNDGYIFFVNSRELLILYLSLISAHIKADLGIYHLEFVAGFPL